MTTIIPLARVTCRVFLPTLTVSLLALSSIRSSAEVRLPALFTDHMVIQQGEDIPVWGWADDGEEITVEFKGQSRTAKAKDGKWRVRFAPMEASYEPAQLVVKGDNTVTVSDVVIGEVWVASGQSNMQWSMQQSEGTEEEIANADSDRLRLFYVPRVKADEPRNDVDAQWTYSKPDTVRGFSAVAYYFGKSLQQSLDVPVGVIHTSWGGSPAEVWMRQDVLEHDSDYRREILDGYAQQRLRYDLQLNMFNKAKQEAEDKGEAFDRNPPRAPWKPSELYNGMIAPLIPYAIKGAIWYQGESNAGRAWQYRSLFPDMIRNWRDDWDQGRFPFLFVQLAPWDKNRNRSLEEIAAEPVESDWAELREAQLLTMQKLPGTGMAIITDLGDKDDIHPRKKKPVGERLALAARGIAYGEDITWTGPIFEDVEFEDGKAIVEFEYEGDGLKSLDGEPLKGFAIAGEDRKFYWADAEISGDDEVIVSSPEVENPVAVRYGWDAYPVVNLANSDGLPASPFRTDEWPGVTQPKED